MKISSLAQHARVTFALGIKEEDHSYNNLRRSKPGGNQGGDTYFCVCDRASATYARATARSVSLVVAWKRVSARSTARRAARASSAACCAGVSGGGAGTEEDGGRTRKAEAMPTKMMMRKTTKRASVDRGRRHQGPS